MVSRGTSSTQAADYVQSLALAFQCASFHCAGHGISAIAYDARVKVISPAVFMARGLMRAVQARPENLSVCNRRSGAQRRKIPYRRRHSRFDSVALRVCSKDFASLSGAEVRITLTAPSELSDDGVGTTT